MQLFIHRFFIAIVFLQLCCVNAFAQAPKPASQVTQHTAGGISSFTLSNGFKLILIPFPTASNVRVELLVKTGSKLEGYGETGMAHLLEHMLFKGAGNRKNIKDDLTAMGANWNGTTTADRTNYFETISSDPEKLDEVIRLEADRFIRSKFSKADLDSEMTVVRNELENSERNPSRLVFDALGRNSFIWHGYSRSTIGARTDIENTSYEALRAFHYKHYRPDNAALIVSGNFDFQRVLALASQLFSVAKNPSTSKQINWTFDSPQALTQRSELFASVGTTIAASSWKLPGVTDRDAHALDLAATAICDADWGSLRKDLVTNRAVAVSAYCYTSADADYSRFVAIAKAGQDADAELISKHLIQHIQDAARNGVTQAQLERARQSELNQIERALDTHESIASIVSRYEVAGDWRLMFWVRDVVQSLSLEEANAALKKWLVATNRGDVLLRHLESTPPLLIAQPASAASRVEGKSWGSIFSVADPAPKSLLELSNSTKTFDLGSHQFRASLITRQTQGDKVWMVIQNDYGTPQSLRNRKYACTAASYLMGFGGGGFNRDALSRQMEELKATWNLRLSGISLEVPRKNLEKTLEILFSVWREPSLPLKEFDSYKLGLLASMDAQLKNPVALADNATRIRFDNFPEGHWSKPQVFEEQIDNIKKLSLEDVQRCAGEFTKLSQARIGIVGNLQEQDVRNLWAKLGLTKGPEAGYERISEPAAPSQVDTSFIRIVKPDTTNAKVMGVAVLALSRKSVDYPALQLAVEVLGGNASSLIWRELREKDGLAYSTGMQISASMLDERTTVQLHATSASSQADRAMEKLKQVLQDVFDRGFTAADIARAKKTWLERRKSYLGKESNFASTLADALYDGYDFLARQRLDEAIEQVTAKQASDVVRNYLQKSPMVWSIGQGK
ncbi:MAG: insulinase family protein [Burkholderiales bacterium]|nr:insulinase family protein [Burkholderiales bacterium]